MLYASTGLRIRHPWQHKWGLDGYARVSITPYEIGGEHRNHNSDFGAEREQVTCEFRDSHHDPMQRAEFGSCGGVCRRSIFTNEESITYGNVLVRKLFILRSGSLFSDRLGDRHKSCHDSPGGGYTHEAGF